jgi:hypothetical protein
LPPLQPVPPSCVHYLVPAIYDIFFLHSGMCSEPWAGNCAILRASPLGFFSLSRLFSTSRFSWHGVFSCQPRRTCFSV